MTDEDKFKKFMENIQEEFKQISPKNLKKGEIAIPFISKLKVLAHPEYDAIIENMASQEDDFNLHMSLRVGPDQMEGIDEDIIICHSHFVAFNIVAANKSGLLTWEIVQLSKIKEMDDER